MKNFISHNLPKNKFQNIEKGSHCIDSLCSHKFFLSPTKGSPSLSSYKNKTENFLLRIYKDRQFEIVILGEARSKAESVELGNWVGKRKKMDEKKKCNDTTRRNDNFCTPPPLANLKKSVIF